MNTQERLQTLVEVYKNEGVIYSAFLIPDIIKREKPKRQFYSDKQYTDFWSLPRTDIEQVEELIGNLFKKMNKRFPLLTYKKRKELFFRRNMVLVDRYFKKVFPEIQNQYEKQKNEEYEKLYQEELSDYESYIATHSLDWIREKFYSVLKFCDTFLEELDLPLPECELREAYSQNKNLVYIVNVKLENWNDFCDDHLYRYSITPKGNPSRRKKTEAAIDREYTEYVVSFAFMVAAILFNITGSIKKVIINGFTDYIVQETGQKTIKCLYGVVIPKTQMERFVIENIDIVAAFSKLEGHFYIKRGVIEDIGNSPLNEHFFDGKDYKEKYNTREENYETQDDTDTGSKDYKWALRILGFSSSTVSFQEVKLAYHKLSKEFHPDMQGHLTESMSTLAREKMAELNEAYDILKKWFNQN